MAPQHSKGHPAAENLPANAARLRGLLSVGVPDPEGGEDYCPQDSDETLAHEIDTVDRDNAPAVRVRWLFSARAIVVVLSILVAVVGVLWFASARESFAAAPVSDGQPAVVAVPPVGGSPGATAPVSSPAASPPDSGPPAAGTATASPGTAQVVVHVVGEVKHPGVFTLPAGSRVFEAISAAGGQLPDAAVNSINLAAVVQDGTQVVVPSNAQVAAGQVPDAAGSGGSTGSPDASAASPAGSGTGSSGGGTPINVNTASADELTQLPRVGPVLAQRIVQWREDHGKFTSLDQLDAVSGIGPKMLESLKGLVTF